MAAVSEAEKKAIQRRMRAAEVVWISQRKDIEKAMLNHPKVIKPLYDCLMLQGIDPSEFDKPDPKQMLSDSMQNSRSKGRKYKSKAELDIDDDDDDADVQQAGKLAPGEKGKAKIAKDARVVADLSAQAVRQQLSLLEPTILSTKNLTAMKGSEYATSEGLRRILEFLTGVGGSFELTRQFATVSSLQDHLKSMVKCAGRRAIELSLPPKWEEQGVYVIDSVVNDAATIRHRFSGAVAVIKLNTTPTHPLTLERNWSDRMAKLVNDGDSQQIAKHFVVPFDAGALMDTPPPKRPLMLTDSQSRGSDEKVARVIDRQLAPEDGADDTE
eukprot:2956414-Amphidinium_carterae.4